MGQKTTSKKLVLFVVLLAVVAVVSVLFVFLKTDNPSYSLIGGDRDEHGCLVPAGYAYDENVGACIRAFDMTPDIKDAARLAVAHVGASYALTVASFNSYEEPGAYDIMLERGVERFPITVVIKNRVVQKPSVNRAQIANLLSQKLSIDENNIVVTIDVDMSDFTKGKVNFTKEGGGGVWFAVKTNKGWEVVYSGNGIIPCDIANSYNFPKDMVPQCLDDKTSGGLIKR